MRSPIAAMALLALAGSAGRTADKPTEDDDDVKANVSVVVRYLDVVVTDRSGDPITDLTKDDFEVYEEGDLQQITDFVARRPEAEGADEAPTDERPYVVLLFDVKHMSFGELDRPRRAARRVLDQVLTADTVTAAMVLRDRLEVVSDFSTDHDGLEAKMDEILWRAPGQGDPRQPPPKSDSGPSHQGGPHLAVSLYPRYAELGPDHSLFGVLEGIGSGLTRMRGPKTIILFSEGISGSLDDARVAAAYRRMIAALNGGNVSVISIDAGGLRGRIGRSDRLFRSLPAINLLGGEGKSSLKAVAKETGGRALIGSSNMSGFLQDTFEARAESYLIGYSPKVTGVGGYRSLEVKVKRRGAKVIARKGFQDEVAPEEVPPEARKEALDRAIAAWTLWQEIPLRTMCVPFPISGKDSLVGIAVEVAGGKLVKGDEVRADLAGSLIETVSRNIHDWATPLEMVVDGKDGDRIRILGVLRIPWGTYVHKAVVRDRRKGKMGATEEVVEVPRLTRVGPLMSGLAILDPNEPSPIVLDTPSHDLASELFTYQGKRLAPCFDLQFQANSQIVLAYGIWGLAREHGKGTTRGHVRIAITRDGKVLRDSVKDWVEATGRGAEILQPLYSPVSLEGLEPGEYVIEASVVDDLAKAESSRSISLTVR